MTGLFISFEADHKPSVDYEPSSSYSECAALATWILNICFIKVYNFDFGFMNIFVNGLLTVIFLFVIRRRN